VLNREQLIGVGAAGAMASAALIAGAAQADKDGFFGQVPAAWVQALGSIAAVGAAASISIMQAGDQRRRDAEELRLRAMDAAEDRVQALLTAIKICEWSKGRLETAATFLEANTPLDSAAALPMVMPELTAFAARLANLSLHGQHMIVRENVLAAEGLLISVTAGIQVALDQMKASGFVHAAPIAANLASNLRAAAVDLGTMATTFGNAASVLGQAAIEVE
jgi:hypothetical protein